MLDLRRLQRKAPKEQPRSTASQARQVLRTSDEDSRVTYVEGGPGCVGEVERVARDFAIRTDVCLAGAKLIGGMRFISQRKVSVEEGSVWGAAILMPQLGRSLGWPSYMMSLTISAYFYLAFCVYFHYNLLAYLAKEELVMDGFGGQMFLCDFGAYMGYKGDHMGPGGTQMTPYRTFNWEEWGSRVFARDAVVALFPGLAHNISTGTAMDPGEYGSESWAARAVCSLLVVLNIFRELVLAANLLKLLVLVPTKDQTWIDLNSSAVRSEKAGHWPSEVTVRVAGMPLGWKALNLCFVFLPKLLLCWMTSVAGICFLMETSAIDNVIINSVALGFLLQMDEIVCLNFMSKQASWLLEKCEELVIDGDMQNLTEGEQVVHHLMQDKLSMGLVVHDLLTKQLPMLICSGVLTFGFILHYYESHCVNDGGRYVSKDLHIPTSMSYSAANFVLPSFFPVEREDEPVWQYSR